MLVQLVITHLLILLTPKPLKLVMMLVTSIVRKANFGSIFKSTQIGMSISEWKKCCVTSVNSISNNVAHLKVKKLKHHAVVESMVAVAEDILADGSVILDDNKVIHADSGGRDAVNDWQMSFQKKLMNIEKEHHCCVVPFFTLSDGYKTANTGGHQSRLSSWGGLVWSCTQWSKQKKMQFVTHDCSGSWRRGT